MTTEEFYKTQWLYPEKMDDFYKCGIRFSYNDMIKFATDYAEIKVKEISSKVLVSGSVCEHFWIDSSTPDYYECKKCGKITNDYEQTDH